MRSFRLGSIFGIEVRIDASWFIVFLLLLWTFSLDVFPAEVGKRPLWLYWAMGLAATLLFFASLLAHELSHSLVARRHGVVVEGITLFLFGGMARTRTDAFRPGDEFVIAGVGPLASLLIALLFGAVYEIAHRLHLGQIVPTVAEYLGWVNVSLAAFNLLPGFPLDGGRLLRSAVWRFTGNLRRATRVAALGGTMVALALIGLGIWRATQGDWLNAVWLPLIGLFLQYTSRMSVRLVEAEADFAEARARTVMREAPATVPPDESIERFLGRALHDQPAWPVVADDGRVLGLVTASQALAVPEAERARRTIADVMIPISPELQVEPDDPLPDVFRKLARGVPVLVIRDGRLAGLIGREHVGRWERRAGLGRQP